MWHGGAARQWSIIVGGIGLVIGRQITYMRTTILKVSLRFSGFLPSLNNTALVNECGI